LRSIVVLDASVAVKWFVHDVLSEQASLVAHAHRFIAPGLILSEVANALWTYARRGDVNPQDLVFALQILDKRVSFLNELNIAQMAARMACEHDHPVYDCMYLAVARMQNFPLLTADKRLSKLARKQNIDVIDLASVSLES
jgi:predicted nucleic acid-binding protein